MVDNTEIILPVDTKTLLSTLNNAGFESYVVGGCVRDSFIEAREVNDWDICTNAKPEQVVDVFSQYNVIETGLQHGTVTVILNHTNYEITTYRVDGEYKDSRRPEQVSFVSDLSEDLKRRDFTINALAYNEKDGLIDYNNGVQAISQKLIKCVGVPSERFTEDALRILRGLRFASVLGFSIEAETETAMFELKDKLTLISSERIMAEFSKLILGVNATEILRKYREIIAVFIPEITKMFDFEQHNPYHKYDVYEHSLYAIEHIQTKTNQLNLHLAAFFHDIGKPTTFTQDETGVGHFYKHAKVSKYITHNILTRLKCSNSTITQVCMLVENHDRQLDCSRRSILRFVNKFDFDFLNDYLTLKEADIKAQGTQITERLEIITKIKELSKNLQNENICYKPTQLQINGNDLIALGVPQGKQIGQILNQIMQEVLEENLKNDKQTLIKYAHQFIQKNNQNNQN